MNYKIKILKDTPFDKKDTFLSLSDFRFKYSYICTNNVPDNELIKFLKNEYVHTFDYYFQVIEEPELPLCFVHEDLWYIKKIDGMYHGYITPTTKEMAYSYTNKETPINKISMYEAKEIISNVKYKNNVLVCTNFVNRQMK